METNQDYLRTGTAMGYRMSRAQISSFYKTYLKIHSTPILVSQNSRATTTDMFYV